MTERLAVFEHTLFRAMFDASDTSLQELTKQDTRWRVYRRMVRDRIFDVVRNGLPRTICILGDHAEQILTQWLADCPPKSRYIRNVSHEFAMYLEKQTLQVHRCVKAMAQYESALIEVECAVEEQGMPETVREQILSEGPVILNPSLRMLHLDWTVHLLDNATSNLTDVEEKEVFLIVYRDQEKQHARVVSLPRLSYNLLHRIYKNSEKSWIQHVHELAQTAPDAVGERWVLDVADLIADWIERGIWLGSSQSTKPE